jgi:hypothetical protein
MFKPTLLALASAFTFACSADVDPDIDRGPIGKADLVGSCESTDCDGASPIGNCFCDAECAEIGDCCADHGELCAPSDAPFCGGLAGLPCPDGMTCVLDGDFPDAGGHCEATDDAPFCGGIAGLPCPDGMTCVLDGDFPDAGGHCVAE